MTERGRLGGRGPGRRRALRIGLTGPIGCGKSTVAGWLADRGAAVVDADRLAREVVEPGQPALAAVVEAFGSGVLAPDGRLDRPALGRRVFGDAAELRRLEAIVHPAVRPRILAAVEAAEATGVAVVVVEAIRLVEGGYARDCDEVWLVVCDPRAQRERLLGRGLPAADLEQRVAAQGDLVARLAPAATRVIDTGGPPDDAERRVADALAEALTAGGRTGPSRPGVDASRPPGPGGTGRSGRRAGSAAQERPGRRGGAARPRPGA